MKEGLTIGQLSEINAELHTEIAALLKERDALAVENAQMLRMLTDISENHDEFVNEADEYMYASVPLDYVSEINMYVSRDVNAENPLAATDAAIANIQEQGLEKYACSLESSADDAERDGYDDAVKFLRSEASGVRLFASQLRNEVAHD